MADIKAFFERNWAEVEAIINKIVDFVTAILKKEFAGEAFGDIL